MSSTVSSIASAAATAGAKAQSILDAPHTSPTVYTTSSPYTIFIIQAGIIILLSRIINVFLGKIKQPRVIGDIIAGLLLGPSVFGRIPGFTSNIFPSASIPQLNMIANIGLIFFLFLVGLETDLSVFKKNAKTAGAIATSGLLIPFALGWAVAYGIYGQFVDKDRVTFSHFGLFIAVALSITAFPVLARILTELRLLNDPVGVSVLAAGVINDIIGWTLLALAVTLVNAGAGITTLYVILCVTAWTLVLWFVIRPLLLRYIRWTGSFVVGPTQGAITIIVLLVLVSSQITNILGVHPIFGSFLVGVILAEDRAFAKELTEPFESFIAVFFLPLYFALSGLSTDLGLLNNGSIWGWTFCVLIVALLSKFVPCALSAKACGFGWRESGACGSLMACKGLVELVVLNIGLQAGSAYSALSALLTCSPQRGRLRDVRLHGPSGRLGLADRDEALVTTFAATPLTLLFYGDAYRKRRALELAGPAPEKPTSTPAEAHLHRRFAIVLSQLEHLPGAMAFVKLLQAPFDYDPASARSSTDEKASESAVAARPTIDALRMVELTERTSAVMLASELDEAVRKDPMSQIFKTFLALNGFACSPDFAVLPVDQFASSTVEYAAQHGSDMIVVPWSASSDPARSGGGFGNRLERSPQYAAFVRAVYADAPCDVAVFLDGGFSAAAPAAMPSGRQHIFLAFHGGQDDIAALNLVVQLAQHPGVSATVVRFHRAAEPTDEDRDQLSSQPSKGTLTDEPAPAPHLTIHGGVTNHDTLYGDGTAVQSETADTLAIARFFGAEVAERPARITFAEVHTASPLRASIARAQVAAASASATSPLLVVAGRGRRGGLSHRGELDTLLRERVGASKDVAGALGLVASTQVRNALGDVGSAVVASRLAGSLLIVQANVVLPKPKSV